MRLKISDHGPIASILQPPSNPTVPPHEAVRKTPKVNDRQADPTPSASSSKPLDPVAGPSTVRKAPAVQSRTLSEQQSDEWSEHWVLSRTHYQQAQVTADRSLPFVFEDDALRFVSTTWFL
jgi:hypothetical protein